MICKKLSSCLKGPVREKKKPNQNQNQFKTETKNVFSSNCTTGKEGFYNTVQ